MSDYDAVQMTTTGLDKILKAVKGQLPVARVGILGSKNARPSGKGKSNATIGAAHEFGTSSLPARSFLRVPISDNLDKYLERAGAFDQEVVKTILKEGSLVAFLRKVGIVAEAIVADAFDTGGFGKWKALSPATIARKKNNQILVETQQLRNSITSEVKE